jgi:hypothetical protein
MCRPECRSLFEITGAGRQAGTVSPRFKASAGIKVKANVSPCASLADRMQGASASRLDFRIRQNSSARKKRAPQDAVNSWSIILAGGEGERMQSFIQRRFGETKPKQYCTFVGSRSLLQHAVDRADALTSPKRRIVVAAKHHEPYSANKCWAGAGADPLSARKPRHRSRNLSAADLCAGDAVDGQPRELRG